MVSTQVITPAVWTETARNLLANPAFVATAGSVELWRNLHANPRLAANAVGWYASAAAARAAVSIPDRPELAFAFWPAAAVSIAGNRTTAATFTGLTPGVTYTASVMVLAEATGWNLGVWDTVIAAPIAGTPAITQRALTPSSAWREESITFVAVSAAASIALHTPVALAVSNYGMTAAVVTASANAVPFFDGSFSPDPDRVPAWIGAVGASASTLSALRVANVTSTSVAQSRDGYQTTTGSGSKAVRFTLLTTAAIAIPIGDVPPSSGVTYTILLRVRANSRPTQVRPRIGGGSTGSTIVLPQGEWVEIRFAEASSSAGVLSTGLFVAADAARRADDTIDVEYALLMEGTYAGPYIDGSLYSTNRKRYRWLGDANGSISVEEILTAREVTAPIFEVVTLTSANDEIVFHADPSVNGFVYDNETLERWYELASVSPDVHKRPNAHGAYGLGQIFTDEHRPLIVGQYYGTSSADAKAARNRMLGMFEDGTPVSMAVTDEEGMTTRRAVWVVAFTAPFSHDFAHVDFDMALIAPDPLRYGTPVTAVGGMPTSGGGLFWDLGTAGSGLYFDWGIPGESGQLTFTNTGKATTYPRIDVGGPGAFGAGFRLTEVETGRELTYARATNTGDVIVFDSRTQTATLNDGGDVTGAMTSRDWFEIPKGQTRRYQINALGGVTGAPTITLYAAPAYL